MADTIIEQVEQVDPNWGNNIYPVHMIQCSYCLKIHTFPMCRTVKEIILSLQDSGWTINPFGAVKCGPCNWID